MVPNLWLSQAACAAGCLLRHEKADLSRSQKAKQYTCERWIYEIGRLGLIEFAPAWCARLSVQGLQQFFLVIVGSDEGFTDRV